VHWPVRLEQRRLPVPQLRQEQQREPQQVRRPVHRPERWRVR